MTRADILKHLQGALSALAKEFKPVTTDTVEGYKLAIDAALRSVGADNLTTPTIATATEQAVLALAEYHALRFMRFDDAPRIDTNTGQNFSVGRSQLFLHLNDMLKEAADRCALLGYPVVASNQPSSSVTQNQPVSAAVSVRAAW